MVFRRTTWPKKIEPTWAPPLAQLNTETFRQFWDRLVIEAGLSHYTPEPDKEVYIAYKGKNPGRRYHEGVNADKFPRVSMRRGA